MSMPSFPAAMRGFKSNFMQSWKICWPCVFHCPFKKHSSFVTGMYPIRTVAWAEGECQTDFLMFLIVRYTGHANLSPLKIDSWVLSDVRMTGAIVALLMSLSWRSSHKSSLIHGHQRTKIHLQIPPPIASPHLVKHVIIPLVILVHLLQHILQVISES